MIGETLVGQTIADRYAVLSEVGSGGFGMVYMAKHIGLNNPVALKVLHAHLVNDKEHVERFRREAEATSRLRHSAIASVHDFGILPDGRPYMVMEFLSGSSLATVMEGQGRLPPEFVVPLFVECCDALRYAHKKGLLHRDIKPDNIFIVKDMDGVEHVKLLDFGLAKMVFVDEQARLSSLTESGTVLGTPWYMSPEQCQAKPLDGRSDIYSLAYSLYEAIAGRRAFPGSTPYEAMHAHLTQRPPALNSSGQEPIISTELESVVLRALSKAPNDRFTTADEFRQALMKAMPDAVFVPATNGDSPALNKVPAKQVSATKSGQRTAMGKKVSQESSSQSTTAFIAAVAVVLLLAAAGCFAMWSHSAQQAAKTAAPVTSKTDDDASTGNAAPAYVPATTPVVAPAVSDPSASSRRLYRSANVEPDPAAASDRGLTSRREAPDNASAPSPANIPDRQEVSHDTTGHGQNDNKFSQLESEISRLRQEVSAKQQSEQAEPVADSTWPRAAEHHLIKPDSTTSSAPDGSGAGPQIVPAYSSDGSPAPQFPGGQGGYAGGQPQNPGWRNGPNPPPGSPGYMQPPPGFPPPPPVPGQNGRR